MTSNARFVTAVTDGRFGMSQEQLSVTIRHIRCQGGERRMLECQHNTWNSSGTCDGQNIAGGVQCSGELRRINLYVCI